MTPSTAGADAPPPTWPAGLEPDRTPVSTRNTLLVPASPAVVWERLVDAADWPRWYAGAHDVVLAGGAERLAPGTEFRWRTLGVQVTCVVDRWERYRLLGWTGRALGSRGHHRWLLTPTSGGTLVVTEETQAGVVPRVGRWWLRRALLGWHQRWLEGIAR